jgi:hypothetical protein
MQVAERARPAAIQRALFSNRTVKLQIENPPEAEFGRALFGVKHDTLFKGTAGKRYHWILRCTTNKSVSILRFPDEKNESCDQSNHDKHPVLTFKTQNREMVGEKMHSFRPAFVQDRRFCGKNILFLYFNRLYLTAGVVDLVQLQLREAGRIKLSAGLSDSSLPNSEGW